MKRFGIFRQVKDGARVFVEVSDDELSAKAAAILLREQSGNEHVVFNLGTKRKVFDTGLHYQRKNSMRTMKVRQPSNRKANEI